MDGGVWLITGVQAAGKSTIEALDEALEQIPGIGLWLDTSDQSPDETVVEVMERSAEAIVDGRL